MEIFAICYKLKTPLVFNAGTRYETRYSDFLAFECGIDEAYAQRKCDELNAGTKEIDGKEVDFFYVQKQASMY